VNQRSPFDMIIGQIKGQSIQLRPVRFDSDNYDKNFVKPNGEFIRPEMGVSTCPICFQLIEQELPESLNLNEVIDVYCDTCAPAGVIQKNFPFNDPFETKELEIFDINPQALKGTILYQKPKTNPEAIVIENTDLEERDIGGIGQFVRKRNQWKKEQKPDEFEHFNHSNGDNHDVMGMVVGEAKIGQSEHIDMSNPK